MMGIRYAPRIEASKGIIVEAGRTTYYGHQNLLTRGPIMAMRRNLLREKLTADKPTVGTHILSAWPTLVELIGHSKQYDYVEFTAEYAPFTMHDLDNLGR